jgi:hypothetical protein
MYKMPTDLSTADKYSEMFFYQQIDTGSLDMTQRSDMESVIAIAKRERAKYAAINDPTCTIILFGCEFSLLTLDYMITDLHVCMPRGN